MTNLISTFQDRFGDWVNSSISTILQVVAFDLID